MNKKITEDIIALDQELWKKLQETGIFASKRITYGTSGFRFKNEALDYIVFRLGFFQALIAQRDAPRHWGIAITASHNPKPDNGVKIINAHTGMLEIKYEKVLEDYMNNPDFLSALDKLIKELGIDNTETGESFIVLGHDTRTSADRLKALFKKSATLFGARILDIGQVATPHVFVTVDYLNKGLVSLKNTVEEIRDYYFKIYSEKYNRIVKLLPAFEKKKIVFDCSNGVGFLSIRQFNERCVKNSHNLIIINKDDGENLNNLCGAEHVHKVQTIPANYDESVPYGISLDGDADRLTYFLYKNNQLELVDGDKMSALIALFIQKVLKDVLKIEKYNLGAVMTNYSNFALKKYLTERGISQGVAKTGVKYLHGMAEDMEVGVYFESNGHGTLTIQQSFLDQIESKVDKTNKEHVLAWELINFINPLTGDAVFNFLQIELILLYLNMSREEFANIFVYKKFKTYKLKVKDKNAIIADEIKAIVVEPKEIQNHIDLLVEKHKELSPRIYIRPSGTEDIIRIHIEADTDEVIQQIREELDPFLLTNKVIN